jgi:hypothetical protein
MQGYCGCTRFRSGNHCAISSVGEVQRARGDWALVMSKFMRHSALPPRRAIVWLLGLALAAGSYPGAARGQWTSYGRNAQHTALTAGPSQLPASIRWSIPVDQNPQYSGDELLIHYGSPVITSWNNILVPVKLAQGGFQISALKAATGRMMWSFKTDYVLPPHNWTPPLGITLTPGDGEVVIPGAGGTVWVRANPDSLTGALRRLAFYGIANFNQDSQSYSSAIQICTPITSDDAGNLYFGYLSNGAAVPGYPSGIPSGLARISFGGKGSFVAASALAGDPNINKVVYNCAPALSADGTKLYVAVNQSSFSSGYLCMVDTNTLKPEASIPLRDPRNNQWMAALPDDGTSAPTVGPDGDVYYGVLEANFPSNHARGWMLHFNGRLTTSKIPGAFGWDDSASIVPKAFVPSYTGSSTYLILTKYNNYANGGIGGDGMNKVAILDPNTQIKDPISGAGVMSEVLTVLGPTENTNLPGVTEWCINSAAIDAANKCAVINSEDGHVYRWDFTTNSLSQGLSLAPATGEAYTSTLIGPDGAVYAINNAQLFCCGTPAPVTTPAPAPKPNPNPNPGSNPVPVKRPPVRRLTRSSFVPGFSDFTPSVLQGSLLIGILAALSVHLGSRVLRRLRTPSGRLRSG